jgi:eukaryotic-like serine/threonine-protein kinase
MPEMIGKYEVVKLIGRGGMGTIYKARDSVLERSVALKVVSSLEVTPELRVRFFREAQACARLSHPNIVTIHDMGEDGGRLFIVMELLEGEELRQLIARRAPLELEEKLTLLRQLCDGLSFAHQKGIVHRDIKPANIFLLKNGRVKILDFGIAQIAAVATQGDLTRTGMIMGTLRYMAPEQVRGRADHRSDIFSVAAVAYELLGGRPPFTGQDPLQILEQLRTEVPPPLAEIDPDLPPELSTIVERGMQKEPDKRFADLGQMAQELELVRRKVADAAKKSPIHRQLLDPPDPYRAPSEPRDAPAPVAPAPVAPAPVAPAVVAPVVKAEEPVAAVPPVVEPPSVAQPTSRSTPTTPAVSSPPTGVAATGFWPREDDESAAEPDIPWFRRVPLVAIGTGLAVAALAALAIYGLRPAATSPTDTPAATVATDQAEKNQAPEARGALSADKQAQANRSLPARPETESRGADGRAADAPPTPPALPPAPPPAKTPSAPATAAKSPAPTPAPATPGPTPAATKPPAPVTPAPPPTAAKTPPAPAPTAAVTPPTAAPAKPRSEPAPPSATPREPSRTAAVDPAVASARDDAEQARVRMNAARRSAEQAAAGFYARKRFNSAQDKERDGMTALGKSEYAAAAGLFSQAQSEYQASVKESALEADLTAQAAKLRANLDEAHAAAASRRQQALAAGADNLARDVFDRAQARQVEGDELATRKDLAGATRAYREAAERYGEAISRARAARPAR